MEYLSEVQTASLRLLLDQAIAVICHQKIVFSPKLKQHCHENLGYDSLTNFAPVFTKKQGRPYIVVSNNLNNTITLYKYTGSSSLSHINILLLRHFDRNTF
jgi:hypothetical protein